MILSRCWHYQERVSKDKPILLIKKFEINQNYHKTIAITVNELSLLNSNNTRKRFNAENFTTKEYENGTIKENNHCNASKQTRNEINEVKALPTIELYYHYRQQFKPQEHVQPAQQRQRQRQFAVDVNLRAANKTNKVNISKNSAAVTSTNLLCQQQQQQQQQQLTTTHTATDNMMATTSNNIKTTWGGGGSMTNTSADVTTITKFIPTVMPNWSSIYEIPNKNSSNNSSNSHAMEDNESEMLSTIEYIGTVLSFYYVPIIVGTGSIGNILSVFVFFKTKLRKLSSSFYLAALAVSDTCFLLGLFAQWLNFVDVNIYNREYFCQFFTFFSNLACFCSVWFVVAFTVERFIAVMYPLRRQTMCTVRRAKIVLIGLTILGCLHCAPFWIFSTPVYSPKLETTICDIKKEYKDYITLLNYWDTIVVFAVPFTTIAVLNTFTGCTVWKFATVRRTLTMQKMKTQHHLTLHETISSHSSSFSLRDNISAATAAAAALANTGGAKAVRTMSQQQEISTYRITNSSLKKQKSASCANLTHSNGQHNHNVNQQHNHHHHQHHQHHQLQVNNQKHHHQPDSNLMHSHPNRATIIKQSLSGNRDCTDIISRKARRRKAANSSQLKVTKMLLIVSTVFVCLNLPSFIMRMITYLETQSSTNEKATVVLQYIFQLLFITNFGINFVLYCVSGQNFRKAVLSMFRKVSTTQRDVTTQITVSEYYRNSAACGTNTSTRRRLMSQNCCNEMHELQRMK